MSTAQTAKSSSKRNSNKAAPVAAAAPAPVATPAPVAAPALVATPGKVAALDPNAKITALVTTCPKRPGTTCYKRAILYWSVYVSGGTVKQALDAGATMADLRWDSDPDRKGGAYIKIG